MAFVDKEWEFTIHRSFFEIPTKSTLKEEREPKMKNRTSKSNDKQRHWQTCG